MRYWVRNDAVKYDSIGNENKGFYRYYIVEIPCEGVGSIYVGHNEQFYRETDAWENENDYVMEEKPDLSNYRQVLKCECNRPDGWTFIPFDKLWQSSRYVETFDEATE